MPGPFYRLHRARLPAARRVVNKPLVPRPRIRPRILRRGNPLVPIVGKLRRARAGSLHVNNLCLTPLAYLLQ